MVGATRQAHAHSGVFKITETRSLQLFYMYDDILLLKYDQQWQKQCFTILFQNFGLTLPPYTPPNKSD